ncbi:MAG TPA: DUF1684 domain-containing protein [Thermoanaerobaculia bacterium]
MIRSPAFRRARLAVLLAGGVLLSLLRPAAGAGAPETVAPDTSYRQEIETWRKDRFDGLKSEDGWFSLVGLFWLDEGENRFGSDPGVNKVILPEGRSPKVAGAFVREGKSVRVKAEPGAPRAPREDITLDGKPVTGAMELKSDATGKPTVLRLGSLSFHVIERGDKIGVRVKDSRSPALAAFHGLDYFPIQPAWRIEARFEPYQPAKKVPIPNVLGQVSDEPSPGAVVFDWQGKTYRLDAIQGSEEGGLFLIFADETNGKDTYGAGRFLDTDPPKDGKVVVDFNTAYNPPCAFTSFATCPLPPQQNKLALRIEAGEKKYGDGHAGH